MSSEKNLLAARLAPWLWGQEGARRQDPVTLEVTQWFEEYRSPLLRYILSLGLPLSDAEDVLQEVFLSLFHHLKQDKPRTNLRGWLFKVGHNLALRRRGRTRPMGDASEMALIDPAPNPEEQAASRHLQSRLEGIFRSLAERERCCMLLRAEGLSYREIAAALNLSLGTVATSIAKSLARLSTVSSGGGR